MMNPKDRTIGMEQIIPQIKEAIQQNKQIVILGSGKSMYPFINEKTDKIVLSPLPDRKAKIGDIYLYRRASGKYAIHRVCRIEKDGTLSMLGDGQVTVETGILQESIIAYVSAVIRNGKTINCNSKAVKMRSTGYLLLRTRFPKFTAKLKKLKHIFRKK